MILSKLEEKISEQILKEIRQRLSFLINVGLSYLTLDRSAVTLSGGEAQRIRLATQIGSQLMGVLYILDEPSIGLHPRDNNRLINTLKLLRDIGNSILVLGVDDCDYIFSKIRKMGVRIYKAPFDNIVNGRDGNEIKMRSGIIKYYLSN